LLDVDRLSAPISTAFPSGRDLRAGAGATLYFRLKDLRSTARAEERNIEPSQPFRLSPAWAEVRTLALEALERETHDLEILAWLAEAELRLHGFAGLGRCFELIFRLVEESFESLHSIDSDSLADRVAPIAGLNGINGEGALIQPIRLSPLVPGRGFFACSLWEFKLSQRPTETVRRKELKQAAGEAGLSAMRAHLADVENCISAFRKMTAALDARCGAEAPASSAIRNVLDEVRLAIINLAGIGREAADVPPGPDRALKVQDGPSAEALAIPAGFGAIRSREEAFDRLIEVADYFRRSEPQSPLSAALDTVVARGRMDFAELLAELVQDEHVRRGILVSAGIRPSLNGRT
jgi:type VI secretion system protein ImpA